MYPAFVSIHLSAFAKGQGTAYKWEGARFSKHDKPSVHNAHDVVCFGGSVIVYRDEVGINCECEEYSD